MDLAVKSNSVLNNNVNMTGGLGACSPRKILTFDLKEANMMQSGNKFTVWCIDNNIILYRKKLIPVIALWCPTFSNHDSLSHA